MGEAKPSMAKINPGDSVLLATSNDTYQFVDAKPSVKFRIGKQQVKATDLVDASFGQLFTLQNKALVPTTRDALNITLEASNNNKKDNRDLDDDNKAQSLDADAIKDMRSRGETGAAIIGALAEGSATWDSKTEFSKAKWLKRKAKKYLPWVQVLEPTANAIAEAYFVRAAGKGRRRDSRSLFRAARLSERYGAAGREFPATRLSTRFATRSPEPQARAARCGPTPSRSSWPAATSAPARASSSSTPATASSRAPSRSAAASAAPCCCSTRASRRRWTR